MKTDSAQEKKGTTVDEIIERLKELPKSTTVVSFEFIGKDRLGYDFKVEYKQ